MKHVSSVALLLGLLGTLSGCPKSPAAGSAPSEASAAPSPGPCGLSPDDWCPSPPGDPCGIHKNTAACRANPRCKGMPYRGESMVACMSDDAGFATNCPTVGCISR